MAAMQQMLMATGSSVPVGHLDDLAVLPRCAHGLRKLISTATLCLDVRHRTSGVVTPIGFSGDTIDAAAIAAAAAGGYLDVSRMYDQTGNGYHLEQATVVRMPNIVAAGVYQGTLKFAASRLATTSALPFGTPFWGIYSRRKFQAIATRVFIEMSANASGANPQAAFLYSAATNRIYPYSQNGVGANRSGWFDCFDTMVQSTFLFNRSIVGTGEFLARQNGSGLTITPFGGTTEQTGNFNSYRVHLGARADDSIPAVMDLDAIVQYDADTTAIAADIEAIVGVAP
jgi:hypothetical protein